MSKGIAGAVELAAGIGVQFIPGVGTAVGAALFHLGIANAGVANAIWDASKMAMMAGISTEAGAIAQALGSKSGLATTTRSPASLRQIIRGEQRVPGVIVYASTTGGSKRQYNLVIALATHTCHAIVNLYLDGRQVYWHQGSAYNQTVNGVNFGGDADGNDHVGPNGVKYNFGGKVFCAGFYGKQTADPTVVSNAWVGPATIDDTTASYPGFCSALQANDGTWSPSTIPVGRVATGWADLGVDGGISDINVNDGGTGYADSTNVQVDIIDQGGTGSGASAHGIASGGSVTSIVVDNPGYNYTNPQVTVAPGATTSGTPYLAGCTYVYLKLEADSGTFPQFPEIRFTVRGKNDIYDPRTGTRGYTTNWALHIADAITDPVWGLGDNSVNQDQLIAAANVCDEQVPCAVGVEARYSLHFHYSTGIGPGDAISQMMDAAAGRLSRIGGEWFIWPAYWQGPSFTFDQDALVDAIQWTPKRSLDQLCNRITGTYIAANYPYNVAGNLYDSNGYYNGQTQNNFPYAFQPSNFPMYACDQLHGYGAGVDVYLTEDGGIYLPKEVNQQCVLSISQAQRVAKIMLLRNRQQGTGTLQMNLSAYQMQPTDVMQFSMSALGWTNKVLEVSGTTLKYVKPEGSDTGGWMVEVGVQETGPSVYEWDPAEELTPYDVPAITGGVESYTVAPPTNITIEDDASTALVLSDGTSLARALVTWTPPDDTYVANGGSIQVQYKFWDPTGAVNGIRPIHPMPISFGGTDYYPTDWVDGGTFSGQATYCYITVPDGYNMMSVQVQAVRSNGATSGWVQDSATVAALGGSGTPHGITPVQPIWPIRARGTGGGVVLSFGDGKTLDALEPLEAGADVTGNHTANDTLNVNGVGAHLISPISDLMPAEAGAEKTTGKDLSVLIGRTADKLSYTAGGTVDSLRPAQPGADVTSANTAADTSAVNGTAASRVSTLALSTSQTNGEFVINGAFENGLTGWSGTGTVTNGAYSPKTGTQYLAVTSNWVKQSFWFVPGHIYRLQAWVATNGSVVGGGSIGAGFWLDQPVTVLAMSTGGGVSSNGSSSDPGMVLGATGATGWSFLQMTFQPTSGTGTNLFLQSNMGGGGVGSTAYFDGVSIIDVTAQNNLDAVSDGTTYGRTLGSRVNAGRPTIDFSEAIHANKHLGNVADGGGRYAAGEAGANVTSAHALTSVSSVSNVNFSSVYGGGNLTANPITGFGWSATAVSTNDVYNISGLVNTSGATSLMSIAICVDGVATNYAISGTLQNGSSAFFASITGLSPGTHTIQIYLVSTYGTTWSGSVSVSGSAMCQRIF